MLPSGTVTFLFTDIEKSTQLWEKHPRSMQQALARHDQLLREEIESRGGYVFKTVGDAFCATFDRVTDALGCALAIQKALLAEEWGDTPIKVRMAVHTGDVEERAGDYFGPDVNRVARLLSAGHGGQILVSEVTAQLARNKLPPQIEVSALGTHQLKDLSSPEHIFQVTEPGLPAEFPALNTTKSHPNNLPTLTTSFIGREAEVKNISRELTLPEHRMLTLTGPGGAGKTRLSLQVAAENLNNYADGVFFVPLASVRHHNFVLSSIMEVLVVRTYGSQPPLERLQEFLADRQMLLILDNFEHVVEAAPLISDLLASAPQLNILVTSRVPLRLYGERVREVAPLALPAEGSLSSPEQLAKIEAIQLFVDRAKAIKTGFTLNDKNAGVIVQICRKLDGLPLAIELVAARIRVFPPQSILDRLDSRMAFVTSSFRDFSPRQRTIRATINWSHHLLAQNEQILFRRLAVFSGGATVEAVESVCRIIEPGFVDSEQSLDIFAGLEGLLDHSLLRIPDERDESRFVMLETIREYAQERLEESGEAELIRRQHADYFHSLAKIAEPELRRAEQVAWLDRLENDYNNLRTALSWLAEHRLELGLEMAAALGRFWHNRGHHSEGREWLYKFLAASKKEFEGRSVYARTLEAAGYLVWYEGKANEALELSKRSIELRKESAEDPAGLAFAYVIYAMALYSSGQLPQARSVIAESVDLYRQYGEEGEEADLIEALFWQGSLAHVDDDLEFAQVVALETLNLAQNIGDLIGIAAATSILGHVANKRKDYVAAIPLYERSLAYFREVNDLFGISVLLMSLSRVAQHKADYESAKIYLNQNLQVGRQLSNKQIIAESLYSLGLVSARLKQYEEAHYYFAEGLQTCAEITPLDQWALAECLAGLSLLLVTEREAEQGSEILGVVERLLEKEGDLDEIFRPVYDQSLAATKEMLTEETFTSALTNGRSMDIGQAIDYALRVNSEASNKNRRSSSL